MDETAEKAAETYQKTAYLSIKQTVTDGQLYLIEEHFGVKAREGCLKP